MRNEHWIDRLSEYLDGELTAREARQLEAHLARCGECAATLDDLRAVVAAAGSLDDGPPERDLWPGIEARLTPRSGPRSLPRDSSAPPVSLADARERRRRIALTVPQLVAAAVALVVLTGATVWVAMDRTPGAGAVAAGPEPVAEAAVSFTSSYDAAIAELEGEFARRRAALDPTTLLVVERNLAIIDEAIAEARRALEADPESGFLSGYVADAMRRKVYLLREATRIQRTSI